MKNKIMKAVARILILTMCYQTAFTNRVFALTSGPTQPEVQSFEPVGTTDMVDLFSGDFNYNVPLLDVDGYPVNISYHSGINVEQEASWVGLGWNINPGVINRSVRGVPDDFNGDKIEKQLHIKPEKNVRLGVGVGIEVFGFDKKLGLNLSAGIYMNSSNYRGLSAGANFGVGITLFGTVSAGVNMGISSQNGADIDYHGSLTYNSSNTVSRENSWGVGLNAGSGYNTHSGLKDVNISVSANFKSNFEGKKQSGNVTLFSDNIPIGLQNYVPVITNSSGLQGFDASIALGFEFEGGYGNGNFTLNMSKLTYDGNGTRSSYGYLYLQNAQTSDIVDFTRDKDGMFNKTMQYLPPGNTTYDVYSVSAQGSGGIFRPYRNDNGVVYDPSMESENDTKSAGLEFGVGLIGEVGANYSEYDTHITSGPWMSNYRHFGGKTNASLYENVYFKQAGELTESPQDYYNTINNVNALQLPGNLSGLPMSKTYLDANKKRDPRGNVISYLTGTEATADSEYAASGLYIQNYTDPHGLRDGPSVQRTNIPRLNTTTRTKDRIAEITQTNKDGSRYVYGIPAINNIQKEATFSVEAGTGTTSIDNSRGTVSYPAGDDNATNGKGLENYYSMTVTPAYAHSYLLTDVLSTDFVDVTGNGPTDDDLGTYVKFNYSLKDNDYRWKTPYATTTAQYSPGFYCDPKDDKASYVIGSKEEWYLHSIETKNSVAEFYTSPRSDGKGVSDAILPSTSIYASNGYTTALPSPSVSYKLDSIKLYNKHDRFINKDNAVPIKTIYFIYDYSLCPGTLNSSAGGKLTLQKIYMKYGNSDKNLLSPYQFHYNAVGNNNANLFSYDLAKKDRWGNFKPNDPNVPNHEYPYVNQRDTSNNTYASAWLLSKVTLPSGGFISVNYESDDYAYVQDKRAMEMTQVAGVGSSPSFFPNDYALYADKNSPFTYIYFSRRPGFEFTSNMRNAYLEGQNLLYYNFNVDIANKGTYEAVRGYANVEDINVCPNDPTHGYVKVSSKTPNGSDASLSPIVYTGLNMARYYLPHIFYPGNDPNESDLQNIVEGLASALSGLHDILENPLDGYVKDGKAKNYNKARSFVRLTTPNLKKQGGGSRVKQITINDTWNNMSGGDNATGIYGNNYDYTITDPYYGTISSGVACYEPLIGGDENPLRVPAFYNASNGSSYPPNDPMELFQEEPVGESLYPPGSVGYSKVTVSSIYSGNGRSAQTLDEYEFYTAKDFPIRVDKPTPHIDEEEKHGIYNSKVALTATQGYSIIMNDMHGKPKSTKNFVLRPNSPNKLKELVTGQTFIYNTDGSGQLNNTVNALKYNPSNKQFEQVSETVGEEIDVTVDSREKNEVTNSKYIQANLNTFVLWIIPIPIPTSFWPSGDHVRDFKSLVTTKIVQQYGILKGVETIKEGAKFYAENTLYNPETGDVLLTTVNNEFKDPQYSMNYPAYWGYHKMRPAYANTGYEETFDLSAAVPPNYNIMSVDGGTHPYDQQFMLLTQNADAFEIGDEVMLYYDQNHSAVQNMKCFVIGFITTRIAYGPHGRLITAPVLKNRYKSLWLYPASYGYIPVAHYCKIIRSGNRNMLSEPMQSTVSLDNPIRSGVQGKPALKYDPQKTISVSVKTYSDSLVQLMPWHDTSSLAIIPTMDTNLYAFGYRGNPRLASEVTYLSNRAYLNAHDRYDGTFTISTKFWDDNPVTAALDYISSKTLGVVARLSAGSVLNYPWKTARRITKYTPWGNEIENTDALNIPSAAVFGLNNSQPVAVGSNTKSDQILSEGFEDYQMLYLQGWLSFSGQSPFKALFPWATVPTALMPYLYYNFTATQFNISGIESHTGAYSLLVNTTSNIDFATSNALNSISLKPFSFNITNSLSSNHKYIFSCWAKANNVSGAPSIVITQLDYIGTILTATPATTTLTAKCNPIDGWQMFEGTINLQTNAAKVRVNLPAGYYYDDIRSFPAISNMKAFVYNPTNHKLIATLDENNFATFYEYDVEGQLVRVNKETERGIMTVKESRNANVKQP